MRYSQIEGLLSAICEDDPNKVTKQLQIRQWIDLYGRYLLHCNPRDKLDFIAQVISDNDCWKEVDKLERVKLDRYEVGRKLLASTTPDGKDNPFDHLQQYEIACCCCFEDKIRELWAEAQSNLACNIPILIQLDSTYNGLGPLVTYWTHYITGYMYKLKEEFKLLGDNNDLHGFQCAVDGKHAEALEYFWNKLQPELSQEEKDDLLMYTATFHEFGVQANSDMVDFAMNHLEGSKYHELLKRNFHKNGYGSILYRLIDSYLFDRVESLLVYLSSDLVDQDHYFTLMYSMFNAILEVPGDSIFIDAGYSVINIMWNIDEFQKHKLMYLQKLVYRPTIIGYIARIVKAGRVSDTLSEMISSLRVEHVKYLQKWELWIYDILKEANLFHDDVERYFAELEQINEGTSGVQDNSLLLGGISDPESQGADNE